MPPLLVIFLGKTWTLVNTQVCEQLVKPLWMSLVVSSLFRSVMITFHLYIHIYCAIKFSLLPWGVWAAACRLLYLWLLYSISDNMKDDAVLLAEWNSPVLTPFFLYQPSGFRYFSKEMPYGDCQSCLFHSPFSTLSAPYTHLKPATQNYVPGCLAISFSLWLPMELCFFLSVFSATQLLWRYLKAVQTWLSSRLCSVC